MIESIALTCLALTVYFEARGEPDIAQQAVAHVAINRAKESDEGLCAVIFEPNQFSWTATKTSGGVVKPEYLPDFDGREWKQAKRAALNAWEGPDFTLGAVYFHKAGLSPGYTKTARRTAQWGLHVFYAD